MGMPRSHSLQVDDADVQFYRDHGYFVYQHPLFPQEKFQRLQTLFAGLLAELPEGKRPEAMDVPHFAHSGLSGAGSGPGWQRVWGSDGAFCTGHSLRYGRSRPCSITADPGSPGYTGGYFFFMFSQ